MSKFSNSRKPIIPGARSLFRTPGIAINGTLICKTFWSMTTATAQLRATAIEIHGKTLRVFLANHVDDLRDDLAPLDACLQEKPLGSTSFIGRKRVLVYRTAAQQARPSRKAPVKSFPCKSGYTKNVESYCHRLCGSD